jgi:hypothetical protein
MKLTPEQEEQVYNQLHDAYDPNSLSRMLSIKLGKRLEDVANVNQDFVTVVFSVVKKATAEDWLLSLLDAAAAFHPEQQALTDFVAKFKAELAPAGLTGTELNPFRAYFLRKGHRFPFVDRERLRDAVEEMHNPLGETRVLLVDGNTRTGKTYINEYLTFLSSQLASHKFYYIDLADDYLPDFRAGDLMTSIARRMGTEPKSVPPQEAQEARWSKLLVEWLISEAVKKQETWWIVIDHLRKVNLRADMQALINRLVKEIDRTNPPVRLVLLDCGGPERLPPDAQNSVEPVEIGPVSKPQLVAFFRDLGTLKSKALAEDALEATAQWILDQTVSPAPDPEQYMARVWVAVARAHQTIFTPQEVPA